jgi:hypothetical protein
LIDILVRRGTFEDCVAPDSHPSSQFYEIPVDAIKLSLAEERRLLASPVLPHPAMGPLTATS